MASVIGDTVASTLDAQITWPLRPIMTSLNGDQSWLISFPRPLADEAAKFYYHIVLEPWLNGPTSQLSSWLIHLALPTPAEISDMEALDNVTSQIETKARKVAGAYGVTRPLPQQSNDRDYNGMIDAILLFFHYLDHCHEPTLRLFDKRIPVVASPEAKAIVEKMGHFDTIGLIQCLDKPVETWRSPDLHPDLLPTWLTAVKCLGHHELNFVAAIVWSHEAEDGTESHEAIFMSPHGIRLDGGPLQALFEAKPQTVKLAMMHGLKESRAVGMMNTFGAAGGLALYRRMGGAKYWIPSHDSKLQYSGIFMWLAWVYDTPRTIDWAIEQEKIGQKGTYEKPNLVEIQNGRCLVLV